MPNSNRENPLLPCSVRHLTYTVDNDSLVNDLSLDLKQGGLTVIVGPNGAGKSLFMRLLHGLVPATTGTIEWGSTQNSNSARINQAMVFQRPILLRRSVQANIEFVLKSRSKYSKEIVIEVLHTVGLENKLSTAAHLLSGGEQQRLALARALSLKPKVLFLDEPTANIDPASTMKIENVLRKTDMQGTKIILVTHDMPQAKRLADDVIFMHRGKIVEHTPANTFFKNPYSDIGRRFIAGELIA